MHWNTYKSIKIGLSGGESEAYLIASKIIDNFFQLLLLSTVNCCAIDIHLHDIYRTMRMLVLIVLNIHHSEHADFLH